jgi:hypothetical protein
MRTDHSFRQQLVRFSLVLLTAILAVGQTGSSGVGAQGPWSFRIQWEQQDVPEGTFFQLCVNRQCGELSASYENGSWSAPLPLLPVGEHQLVLQSCTKVGCVAGVPDLMIRVQTPSPRRPPIDVISGPRIPVNRR